MNDRPTDLHAKGLLDQTLVVVGTEFGPVSWINDKDGRDHHRKSSRACWLGVGSGAERQFRNDRPAI